MFHYKNTKVNWFAYLLTCVLLWLFVLISSPSVTAFVISGDPGTQLSKGQQILFGYHPYRDVDTSVYGPAIFYLSAAAQMLSKTSIIGEYTIILFGFAVAYALFLWVAMERSKSVPMLLLFGILCAASFPRFYKYHLLLAQAIFLASLCIADRQEKETSCAIWLSTGIVATAFFRLDLGAYAFASSLVYMGLRAESTRKYFWAIGKVTLMAIALSSPWWIFLSATGNLPQIIVTTLSTAQNVATGLSKVLPDYLLTESPLASPNSMIISHLAVKYSFLVYLGLLILASRVKGIRFPLEWAMILFALLAFLQALYRPEIQHLKQALIPALLVGICCWGRLRSLPTNYRISNWLGASLVLLVSFLCTTLPNPLLRDTHLLSRDRIIENISSWTLSKVEILELASKSDDRVLSYKASAFKAIKTTVPPGEPVLFLPFQAQGYYFSERHFETPFGWLNPGRFLVAGKEEAFINAMANTAVVLDTPRASFDRMPERNLRVYASALANHIYTQFRIETIVGPHVILARRPFEGQITGMPKEILSPIAPMHQVESDGDITINSVNTLKPSPGSSNAAKMPVGGALLLSVNSSDLWRTRWGLQSDSLTLLGSPKNSKIRWRFLDTTSFLPGKYRIVFTQQRDRVKPKRISSTNYYVEIVADK